MTTHLVPVYRSEIIDDHLNPLWKEACVNLETFCDGNLDADIIIKLFDYDRRKSNFIGQVETTVRQLMESVVRGGNADRSRALHFREGDEDVQGMSDGSVGMLLVLKMQQEVQG